MLKKSHIRKGEQGAAYIFIIVMMGALVAFLVPAFSTFSLSDLRSAERQKYRTQAYFVARAGAEALSQFIINTPLRASEIIDKGVSAPVYFGEGHFQVQAFRQEENDRTRIIVHSEGNVKEVIQSTRVVLVEQEQPTSLPGPLPEFDLAVFSNSNFNLGGSSQIVGSAGTNSVVDNSVVFGWSTQVEGNFYVGPGALFANVISKPRHRNIGNIITGSRGNLAAIRNYSMPVFPEFPDLPGRVDFVTDWVPGENYSIDQDGSYELIRVTGNRRLRVDVGDGDRRLRVRNLDISQGHIELIGKGKLFLYVEESFNLGGDSTVNHTGVPGDVIMFYRGSARLRPAGNTRFVGSIFAEKANIDIRGSAGITGHIITGGSEVTVTGDVTANVRVLYAPQATVSLTGSAMVRGAIVSNIFNATGAASVIYDQSIASSFPELVDELGEKEISYHVEMWMAGTLRE
ncbi:MAG TPA: hypothetical protein VLH40_08260 [Atribacteraceae bacterium]|nr:hypothetical protein [Atribacteraceae bacterium]